jgi:hypothetical protein
MRSGSGALLASRLALVLRVLAEVRSRWSRPTREKNPAKRARMRATVGLSGYGCGADAEDRPYADHEQRETEHPAGGVGFPPWRSSRRRLNVNEWPPSG